MRLFVQYLENEVELLSKNGVRLRAMGDLSRLSTVVQEALKRCEDRTKHLDGMDLIVAVSYGGRGELVHAFRKIAESVKSGEIEPKDISEEMISAAMYMPDVPHPDLLIRTSNEQRISNFLLWQLAYSEIVVSPLLWPDFSRDEFHRCLHVFAGRSRRFGLTQEQIR